MSNAVPIPPRAFACSYVVANLVARVEAGDRKSKQISKVLISRFTPFGFESRCLYLEVSFGSSAFGRERLVVLLL